MAYYQGQNDNCWTFAGAQCVTSYLLSTYGIILDFSAVRTHGQGTIPINAGGTFQTFLDNISKVDFMSVDSTASYRVKLQPKDATQEYISGSKNYWHGNNPYVTYELEEGNHAVAAVRYNSNLTGLACKNSWGTFGQLTDVSFASILEILECEAIEVKKIQLKSVAGKRKAVETNVTPIAFMAGSAWRLIFNELNNFVAEHDDTENFEPDLIFSKLRDIYREHLETEGSAVTVFSCTANNSRYAYDEGYWIDLHSPGRRVEDSPSFRQTISIDAAIPSNVHVGSTANRGRDAVLNA